MTELQAAANEGRLSDPVTWNEARELTFLDACVKEAGRLHPALGLPLERIAPPEGAEICGQRIKGGTIVGINAWVAHRDRSTFGNDADEWRPERWLSDEERESKRMEGRLLTFGAGTRACIGKHISFLEIYKVVPTLLRRFEIQLVHPERDWHVENRWFVIQTGFNVYLRKREPGEAILKPASI